MKQTRERIACACWEVKGSITTIVIPVPNNMLPMDLYNQIRKENKLIADKLVERLSYITTHGNIVDEVEAFNVALEANQLIDNPSTTKKLVPMDIWPR